ncbi:chemotaxis protein [Tamlana nanhaiensis]|uniref:Chemotaxis protein n=1 Tax=Neotamlana nanhaiensis TaxID=1382798 RepID=A0A0D7W6U9_9FLAO|nr:MCP four helix bundle domain-containing protein [Tamlana nanhaiensis]KJD34428.1 chemotaxis protein [Tamlana nanhaiensis]
MTFYNKIKWILGILIVFVLIITTNLIDKNNFVRVRDSVETIYEDRLIAKDLIFEMLKSIQEKELAVLVSDSTFFKYRNETINDHLTTLVLRFDKTKLTKDEAEVFGNLKENVKLLIASEKSFVKTEKSNNVDMLKHISGLKENLNDLSKIQIDEGRRQMSISKRAVDTVELFTHIEIYFLIFLAVVVQVIIMYQPKDKEK